MTIEQRLAVLRSVRPMRACVIVLGVIAACGSAKSALAPTETLPTADEVDVPSEVAPPTGEKEQKEPDEAKKPQRRRSRWDPPADMPHLASTEPKLRRRIDELVTTMMDFYAGLDSLDAKEALIAIGKPAFPRILGAMAKIRDTITDVDSAKERLIETSLKLADECLREMDGWLTAKAKAILRPGSEKRYIAYICRLHYKRWTQKLQHMDKMPGPYDTHLYEAGMITRRLEVFLKGKLTASSTLVALFDADALTLDLLGKRAWTAVEKVPARMKKERESRGKFGPLLVHGLNHNDLRLRTLARDCLRVLYDKTIYYDPNAPPARRKEKMQSWREVIEAADK